LRNTKFFSYIQSCKTGHIPINIRHAVFCREHAVEPEADVESSNEEEREPEDITLSSSSSFYLFIKRFHKNKTADSTRTGPTRSFQATN